MSGSFRVYCNGATPRRSKESDIILEWRDGQPVRKSITIGLPSFVQSVVHLPDRLLDLLEIASYVFCADRRCSRGRRDDLEFNRWARSFEIHMRVREPDFWNSEEAIGLLSQVLCWMTGDHEYKFRFVGGHETPPTSLFDVKDHGIEFPRDVRVLLFSGGLDSLAGAVEILERTNERVCLVSHQSQPGTISTQYSLFTALRNAYPDRVFPYHFRCTLSGGKKAPEETQRTRALLYYSIALAVSRAISTPGFSVYENGVTALNLPKRRDMLAARASRTVHPKTVGLLKQLFDLITEDNIQLLAPFMLLTKTDIMNSLNNGAGKLLINSSTSCSRTYQVLGGATHCGGCSQCIDRRFAAYAAEADSSDEGGIYATDFINDKIENPETKTALIDFLRQAKEFGELTVDGFASTYMDELADIAQYVDPDDENDGIRKTYELCRKHGHHVRRAIKRMFERHRDYFKEIEAGSLFSLIEREDHLHPPVELLAGRICGELSKVLPIAFQTVPPKDEGDLNDKIEAYLSLNREKLEREYPAIPFALGSTVPDHSYKNYELLLESKYLRKSTSPGRASKGIAEDLIKYPDESFKLFLVYDPERLVVDDQKFKADLERNRRCRIHLIR